MGLSTGRDATIGQLHTALGKHLHERSRHEIDQLAIMAAGQLPQLPPGVVRIGRLPIKKPQVILNESGQVAVCRKIGIDQYQWLYESVADSDQFGECLADENVILHHVHYPAGSEDLAYFREEDNQRWVVWGDLEISFDLPGRPYRLDCWEHAGVRYVAIGLEEVFEFSNPRLVISAYVFSNQVEVDQPVRVYHDGPDAANRHSYWVHQIIDGHEVVIDSLAGIRVHFRDQVTQEGDSYDATSICLSRAGQIQFTGGSFLTPHPQSWLSPDFMHKVPDNIGGPGFASVDGDIFLTGHDKAGLFVQLIGGPRSKSCDRWVSRKILPLGKGHVLEFGHVKDADGQGLMRVWKYSGGLQLKLVSERLVECWKRFEARLIGDKLVIHLDNHLQVCTQPYSLSEWGDSVNAYVGLGDLVQLTDGSISAATSLGGDSLAWLELPLP